MHSYSIIFTLLRRSDANDIMSNSNCSQDYSASEMMMKLSDNVADNSYVIDVNDPNYAEMYSGSSNQDNEHCQLSEQGPSTSKVNHPTTSEGIDIYQLGRMLVETRFLKRANGKRSMLEHCLLINIVLYVS